ncbi:Fe-S cluster assembly protein NifU [Aquisphaera insulae]|uniref:Fe-S cluster assembly protein NifU n=1 Tax=Aquisphaera insulae TaxID=2712864 RepID=UPI0013EE177D|nr:Fe-S cluster assembly protein NifU [Aquisphaera insulae]
MWEYSEKVKDHFFQPRNAGPLAEANAVGEIGAIACGDALRLMLRVDPESDRILDARFQTFGCGSAIASSSALTEIVKGMTLDQALKVSNQDIADYLDGLPPEKMHCSVMGREALQAAVANYRGEELAEDHEEGDLVCHCFGIHAGLIEEVVASNRLSTVEDVTNYTKAGGGCCSCHEKIEDILDDIQRRRGNAFDPPAEPAPAKPLRWSEMTMPQRVRRVEAVIDKIRPQLQADHGDLELVEIDGKTIYVTMLGACKGCAMESATLGGVQQKMMEEFGEFLKVLPASRMKAAPAEPMAIGGASHG